MVLWRGYRRKTYRSLDHGYVIRAILEQTSSSAHPVKQYACLHKEGERETSTRGPSRLTPMANVKAFGICALIAFTIPDFCAGLARQQITESIFGINWSLPISFVRVSAGFIWQRRGKFQELSRDFRAFLTSWADLPDRTTPVGLHQHQFQPKCDRQ